MLYGLVVLLILVFLVNGMNLGLLYIVVEELNINFLILVKYIFLSKVIELIILF